MFSDSSSSIGIQERIASKVLHALIPLAIVGISIAIAAELAIPEMRKSAFTDMSIAISLICVWWILHKGYVRLAAHILIIALCLIIFLGMAMYGGVQASIYILSLVVIPLIAILYGPRYSIFFTCAFVTIGLAFLYMDSLSMLHEFYPPPSWILWLFISIDCFVIWGATIIPANMLHQALAESEKERINTEAAYQREKQALHTLSVSQEVVRESEERFRMLIRLAPIPLGYFSSSGVPAFFNDRFVKVFGYTVDDVPTLEDWFQRAYPDMDYRNWVMENWADIVSRSMRTGTDIEPMEYNVTCKDGTVRVVEISGIFLGNDFLASFVDVTERKQAEMELQRAHDFITNIVNAIGDPVFVKDEEHRYVIINDAQSVFVGCSREDMIGKSDKDFFPPEQVDIFWEMDKQVLSTGQDNINEESLTNSFSGETRIIVTRKTRYIDPSGKRFIVGISRDITKQKQAEEALRKSEERFRIAVECTSDFIYERDMSTGEAEFFGDIDACLGFEYGAFPRSLDGWLKHIHPDDIGQVLDTIQNASQNDGRYVFECRLKRKNGTYADWLDRGVVLRNEFGYPVKCIGGASDISERKQAEAEKTILEEQLRQSHKMEAVGNLAGGVAHEFNNLLQIIMGLVEMVQLDIGAKSENGLLLEDAYKAGRRAADLTQQLLAFGRRQTLMPVNLDMNTLIQDELKILRRLIEVNVELKFIPGNDLGAVYADRRQMEVILMNLCANARDAMPKGGTLTIDTSNVVLDETYHLRHEGGKPGRYVRISVTDTGYGMDEKLRTRIFEPFFTTKDVGKGTGLGLATVYGIVVQHKGMIDCYSEPGKGTAFNIYLPIVDGTVEKTKPRKRISGPGGTETILIADDEEMLLNLLERMLTRAGYDILKARDGEETLRVFAEHADEIDLVILDVIMPKFDGQEVMERIKVEAPNMRFLFSSGYSENTIQTDFVIKEGLRLVNKPYESLNLLNTVREVLDASDRSA